MTSNNIIYLWNSTKNMLPKLYRGDTGLSSRGWIVPILFFLLSLMTSCRVSYSFTGASISPNVKTVTIMRFPNNAGLVVPTLSRTITEALRDYFTSQTNLNLVERNGDLNLEGSITQYAVVPVAIQGNETAALNRLTIVVSVKFSNKTDPKQNWETTFSRYRDYSSTYNLSSVQEGLIKEITDDLVQDIFNKAVVNW
jgi:hypothetical protein